MRYPHDNFPESWSLTAGYEFGDKTVYGFHDGLDVNNRLGGNSDLGLPIYAEADGVIVLVHHHVGEPTFGHHFFLKVEGPWGVRFMHHGHCGNIYVNVGDIVKEGQLVATIGRSGTEYAHDHWAVCKELTGDNVANTQEELNRLWEDPIQFIEKWKGGILTPVEEDMVNETYINDNIRAICGTDGSKDEVAAWLKRFEDGSTNTYDFPKELLNSDSRPKDLWPTVWGLSDNLSLTDYTVKELASAIIAKA